MSDLTEADRYIAHMKRIMDNLDQHWHSIKLLLSHVSKPLLVDDRGLAQALRGINEISIKIQEDFKGLIEKSKELDIVQTFNEIKYIGSRLKQIEKDIAEMKTEGIPRKIEVELIVDGYKMVKKPINYDITEPVEEPDQYLYDLLKTIPVLQAKILVERLGLFGAKPKTFKAVGEIVKMSAGRTSVLFKKAMRQLRHPSRKDLVTLLKTKKLKDLI